MEGLRIVKMPGENPENNDNNPKTKQGEKAKPPFSDKYTSLDLDNIKNVKDNRASRISGEEEEEQKLVKVTPFELEQREFDEQTEKFKKETAHLRTDEMSEEALDEYEKRLRENVEKNRAGDDSQEKAG